MNADQPLLTIAIPTFNRARYLGELLACLLVELAEQPSIELLISDNASPDATPQVVCDFQERGLRLEYIRNKKNIGPDPNFRQCFERAKGKYVWVFGDDDLLVPGAIAKIVNLLDHRDYSLVYVSPYFFRTDPVAERTSDRLTRTAQILPGGVSFARKAGAMIGFLSAIIANKQMYSSVQHESLAKYADTNLMQIGWVCPLLAADAKTLFVWERLVAARGGNTGGWGICQVFGVNFKEIVDEALSGQPAVARALQVATLRKWFPDMIMQIRRGDAKKMKDERTRAILEPIYGKQWRYWTYVYPLIVLPLSAAGVWFDLILLSRRVETVVSMLVDSMFSAKSFVRDAE